MIDLIARIACGDIYEVRSNLESLLFLKKIVRFYPFTVKGIKTDNDSVFANRYTGYSKSSDPLKPRLHPFDKLCRQLGASHYLIDPGKPSQNGKVERFHRNVKKNFTRKRASKILIF